MTISSSIKRTKRKNQSKPFGFRIIFQGLRKAILYLLLVLAALWSTLPLFWVFISSIKPDTETFAAQQTLLPVAPTLNNYETLYCDQIRYRWICYETS
jgi:ABC-type glycerol-3-phosphate transport system permease component